MYSDFVTLIQTRKQRHNDSFYTRAANFNKMAENMLNNEHNVKIEDIQWTFYSDQRSQMKKRQDLQILEKYEKKLK